MITKFKLLFITQKKTEKNHCNIFNIEKQETFYELLSIRYIFI